MTAEPRIRVSAILRWRGRILLCRHEKPGREYRLLPGGSARTQRTFGFFVFRNSDTPANVPPVPLAQVNALMAPLAEAAIAKALALK